MEINEQEIWKQLNALGQRVQPVVAKYTVVIYVWQDELRTVGTGVLLQISDRVFLLSAAHVMDLTYYRGIQFYTSISLEVAPPIPLCFKTRDSSARDKQRSKTDRNLRDNDPYDFSIAELDKKTILQLEHRYKFLRLGDLDTNPLKPADGIFVYGFPESYMTPGNEIVAPETFPVHFVTTPLQSPPEPRDENKDILLYYPKTGVHLATGTAVNFPNPRGLSGCGLWLIARAPQLPMFTPLDTIRLIGIQHRWRSRSRYLVGTSISRVIDCIYKSHPELRSYLDIVRVRGSN